MKKVFIIALSIFSFSLSFPILAVKKDEKKSDSVTTINWPTLRELNYKTGTMTPKLKALDGQVIGIAGYMVPFEDNQEQVTEFILVPDPLACIHVPAPPPNQMFYVKVLKTVKTKVRFTPIWVSGKFHLQTNDSPYGKISFYLEANSVDDFKGAD
ncbi:MAG: hypothetical protein JWQ35_2704 [Bacteriovoracaceae bacterium]|nr:hypothetical protein [Bacteriovoracaceae bacterium]